MVVVDQGMRADWADRTRTELDPVLAAVRRDFPDLSVSLEVRHGPAAEVLLEAATHCDLLVVGRRHHLLPLGTHLGPVARSGARPQRLPGADGAGGRTQPAVRRRGPPGRAGLTAGSSGQTSVLQ